MVGIAEMIIKRRAGALRLVNVPGIRRRCASDRGEDKGSAGESEAGDRTITRSANGVVYAGSFINSLSALDARTGAKLWSFATGDGIISAPSVESL